MLVAVAAIVLIGYRSGPEQGVRRTSSLPSPTHPLFKPEPALLLSRPKLGLSAAQQVRLRGLDARWQRDKSRLQIAMAGFQPKQGRVEQISAGLEAYSSLSREYDATRSKYWADALAALTPAQQKEVQP